jgi:hypothetical protein
MECLRKNRGYFLRFFLSGCVLFVNCLPVGLSLPLAFRVSVAGLRWRGCGALVPSAWVARRSAAGSEMMMTSY